ncbi:MAG: hypothetical protein HY796_11995 [Elusimicrobia bacterium]|nr:hypothetical protein [Elusimicrobiota bacterium]
MKRILLSVLFAGTLCVPGFAQFSDQEQAFVQKCYDNVDKGKKRLSPETADECVKKFNDDADLLNKLRNENPAVATDIVAYNNALIDLRNIVNKNRGMDLAKALSRVLEQENCALCNMDLGPGPENIFGWVDNNADGRLFEVKKSVRTWEALGEIRLNSLSSADYGYNKAKWNEQNINKRYESLSGWAREETDKLAGFYAPPGYVPAAAGNVARIAAILREDLILSADAPYRAKLDRLLNETAKAGDTPVSGKSPADEKKARELASASDKFSSLKGKSALEQQDALNKYFDNADAKKGAALAGAGGLGAGLTGGAGGKEFKPVPLTNAQAGILSSKMASVKEGKFTGYLADEMKGTKAGDEIIGFFKNPKYAKTGYNDLNLKFEKGEGVTANALGWWSGSDKTTRVNTKMVDDFCARNKITPEQLLASDAHMKNLATYIAPNFVHETTHQRQDAWAKSNGLDFKKYAGGVTAAPYQMEDETEAFSMQAAFSAEKAKKLGPAYLAQLNYSHRFNAEKFMEDGVDALRTDIQPRYSSIDSMEGSAARELQQARATAIRLTALEKLNRANPAAMTEIDKADLAQYREIMNTRFKWYAMVYHKSAADEKKLLAWRDSFDSDAALSTAPPAL